MTTTNSTQVKPNAPAATTQQPVTNAVVTKSKTADPKPTPQQDLEAQIGTTPPANNKPDAAKLSQPDTSDNQGVAEQKTKQSTKKQEEIAKEAKREGKVYQGVAVGLGAAAAVAACVPPVGTVIGAVLGIAAALVSVFGGKKAKQRQEQMADEQSKAKKEQVDMQVRDAKKEAVQNSTPEFKGGTSSSGKQLAAAAQASSEVPAPGKPSPAAEATLVAGSPSEPKSAAATTTAVSSKPAVPTTLANGDNQTSTPAS